MCGTGHCVRCRCVRPQRLFRLSDLIWLLIMIRRAVPPAGTAAHALFCASLFISRFWVKCYVNRRAARLWLSLMLEEPRADRDLRRGCW
jgi:hypothetical protein